MQLTRFSSISLTHNQTPFVPSALRGENVPWFPNRRCARQVGKPAARQTWKSALRGGTYDLLRRGSVFSTRYYCERLGRRGVPEEFSARRRKRRSGRPRSPEQVSFIFSQKRGGEEFCPTPRSGGNLFWAMQSGRRMNGLARGALQSNKRLIFPRPLVCMRQA